MNGDLTAPRLEAGKHDAYAWVGLDDVDLVMDGRTDVDRRLRDIVASALRGSGSTRARGPTRLSLALLLGAFIGIRQQVLAEEAHPG